MCVWILYLCDCSGNSPSVPPTVTLLMCRSQLATVCVRSSRLQVRNVLFVAKNNKQAEPSPPTDTPNKCVLHPSSLSIVSRYRRMPQPNTWDRNLQSWQMVVLPSWSTGPLAQNTTCTFRMGGGRMTFTVMYSCRVSPSPISQVHFLCKLVFFSVPPCPPCTVYMQQQHFSPHQKDEVHGATS